MSWALFKPRDGMSATHILPLGDWRDHEATVKCWCKPAQEDDDSAWVHTSMDGREAFEEGTRLPS